MATMSIAATSGEIPLPEQGVWPESQRFDGGYFDGNGAVHFYDTDYQGNITAVISKTGVEEQRNAYYPYGALLREPTTSGTAAHPFMYSGKERLTVGNLNEYDFDARRLPFALPVFTTIDPLAEKNHPTSVYSYCAGDPINFIDKTGMDKSNLESDNELVGTMPENEKEEDSNRPIIEAQEDDSSESFEIALGLAMSAALIGDDITLIGVAAMY